MRLSRRRTTAARRGRPLWLHLVVLAVLPLLGVGLLGAILVSTQIDAADSALRAERSIGALARLDAARLGVEGEMLPSLATSLMGDPAEAVRLGVPGGLLPVLGAQMQPAVAGQRAATDAALAAIRPGSAGAAAAADAGRRLIGLRERADAGGADMLQLYFDFLDVSTTLQRAQSQAAAAAGSEEVSAATLRAVRDVDLVSGTARDAARLFPVFLATQLMHGDLQVGSRLSGETGWVAYADSRMQMEDLSQPALLASWQELARDPVVSRLDELVDAQFAGTPPVLSIGDLLPLLAQSTERDARFASLVDAAVDRAQSLAAADRAAAEERVWQTRQLVVAIALLAAFVVVWFGRRLTRSLRNLADRAEQISRGELIEVDARGPREVRTVAAALAAAVGSLRRIQAQASAVARGDLDDDVLHQPLPGPLGSVVHASVRKIVSAVRTQEQLRHALSHQATHDALTGLVNRGQARTLLTAALERGRRSGAVTGVLFVDLDGFKAVNDNRGHAFGDQVLRAAAERMLGAVRAGDVVCRLGGDEFVVIVEDAADQGDLVELAERLIVAVGDPVAVEGEVVSIGASVGIAWSGNGRTDADVLLAEADTAVYRAKDRGRGRAELFDDALREQLAERAELESAIVAGLAHGEMQLHYQPVLDVTGGELTGFEALLRWERPGRGLVPPDEFIPLAESSALICDLDRWVLHEATRQLAEWRTALPAGVGLPTVAVNVSGRHLADGRIVRDVTDALTASGLPADALVLEVTETVLVTDTAALRHLEQLRQLGVAIAIDDFGTGYTSIGQLRRMPVDTLKIDRSFVAAEDGQRELVELMIRAAHTFGLTVVAEGVEHPAQLAALRADGCDLAQGYLLSRPLPAADAGALLAGQPATVG